MFEFSGRQYFEMVSLVQDTVKYAGRDNNRCVGTHEKNSGDAVRRLGPIIQSIFN